jgi:hypothetical protein
MISLTLRRLVNHGAKAITQITNQRGNVLRARIVFPGIDIFAVVVLRVHIVVLAIIAIRVHVAIILTVTGPRVHAAILATTGRPIGVLAVADVQIKVFAATSLRAAVLSMAILHIVVSHVSVAVTCTIIARSDVLSIGVGIARLSVCVLGVPRTLIGSPISRVVADAKPFLFGPDAAITGKCSSVDVVASEIDRDGTLILAVTTSGDETSRVKNLRLEV